jgi:glycosyltransferase involved in cell wall biosynthesis
MNTSSPTPAISVVMSVYNGGGFLRSSIDSILNQTFKDFEFIIINDGSTDGSRKVIESYKDPRIRLYNQSNKGLVYSLNKGCELARANLIARMDADDISMPSRLEKQVKLMSMNKDLVLVGSSILTIDNNSKKLNRHNVLIGSCELKQELLIRSPFAHGSTMFRKESFIEVGGYNHAFWPAEDYYLWLKLSQEGDFVNICEPLYQYRENKSGISSQNQKLQQEAHKNVMSEAWKIKDKLTQCKPRLTHYKKCQYGKVLVNRIVDNSIAIAKLAIDHKSMRLFTKLMAQSSTILATYAIVANKIKRKIV